ncbi:MAG: 4-(cytidine 5'-diphospho)-2-C-methyl-D-erythritol kinase [Cyclobacteriaceae bacterium]|nr:4-(cytidine 5'-diphospho)-2-C-methyl-D-erythritol kinase [Cyclobacteriaceae bacterium]
MLVFPNAKINIGLNIIDKLPTGYHRIESCFYPVPLTDALEVIETDVFSFTSSGIAIPGNETDNLCLQAYQLVKTDYSIPPVSIHLHKNIPIGAGLGGGSADGAFMIRLLNDKFELGIPLNEQEELASKLGSDCPFFIRNKPVFVEDIGNVFSKIDLSLTGYYLVLVMPNIHVSTKEAYAAIIPKKPTINLKNELENTPIINFQKNIKNDFEVPVFNQHPELSKIKKQLVKQGAIYASMSGSGASVYGIFDTTPFFNLDYPFDIFQL